MPDSLSPSKLSDQAFQQEMERRFSRKLTEVGKLRAECEDKDKELLKKDERILELQQELVKLKREKAEMTKEKADASLRAELELEKAKNTRNHVSRDLVFERVPTVAEIKNSANLDNLRFRGDKNDSEANRLSSIVRDCILDIKSGILAPTLRAFRESIFTKVNANNPQDRYSLIVGFPALGSEMGEGGVRSLWFSLGSKVGKEFPTVAFLRQ